MATRTELLARAKADQKRLAATSGPRPLQALRRLSAREIFAIATAKREQSRPLIKERVPNGTDKLGRRKTKIVERRGEPTFRNRIDDNGAWV